MKKNKNSYKKSGVNIPLANELVKHIAKISKKNVQKTKKSNKKDIIGGFGSLFDISNIKIKDPVIVSCTDGVGTKIDLASKFNKFDTIGIDLVAMCVNDLIVQGAKPLFFLDYIAVGKLDLKKTKKILKGIFKGCKIANCKLIGGETAEMPGVYSKNKFDLAGFSVGIVSKKKIIDKSNVIDAVFHALKWFKERKVNFDAILLLQPTSPLRKESDVIKMIKIFKKKNMQSIMSVSKAREHPFKLIKI